MTDTNNDYVSKWLAQEGQRRRLIAEARPSNKQALFDALSEAGITRVIVTFDGSGDSGQIENIDAFAGDTTVDLPPGDVEFLARAEDGDVLQRETRTVRDAIETLAYDCLEERHDGWENNDGAFGEFTFDVKERSITLGYNERFSDTNYYEHTY